MKTKTRANAGERKDAGSRARARRSRGGQRGHDRPHSTRSVTVATDRTTESRSGESTRREDDRGDDHPLVRLQRRHGNQAVQRYVTGVVQPALRVGRPNDRYEREADDVAARVTSGRPVREVRHLDPGAIQRQPLEEREEKLAVGAAKAPAGDEEKGVGTVVKEDVKAEVKPAVREAAKPEVKKAATEEVKKEAKPEVKKEAKPEVKEAAKPEVKKAATEEVKKEVTPDVKMAAKADATKGVEKDPELAATETPKVEEKEELIQRKEATSTLGSGLGFPVPGLPSGGGESLPPETLGFFEARFGRAFDGVRVHADGSADAAAQVLDAKAFTHGRDIYFRSGQYRPDNPEGRRLLAHELTHTVQQRHEETPRRQQRRGDGSTTDTR